MDRNERKAYIITKYDYALECYLDKGAASQALEYISKSTRGCYIQEVPLVEDAIEALLNYQRKSVKNDYKRDQVQRPPLAEDTVKAPFNEDEVSNQ